MMTSFIKPLGILLLFFLSAECENDGQCERGGAENFCTESIDSKRGSHFKQNLGKENLTVPFGKNLKGDDIGDNSHVLNFSSSDDFTKDGCKTPEGMMRLIPNSKYFVRKDLGPVPYPKSPPHYRPVKDYCESLNLKLPTIQHHSDYVSLQEYILTLAHANPERILTKMFGWKYTDRMVFLDVKFHKSGKWISQQNSNASVYVIWDWSYPDNTGNKPKYGGINDTRVMVNAIRFYQKWNKTDDENDDKNKYWMAASSGNQRVKNKFHPLVLCQFPEGSECHLKSHEEKQNQIEIKAAEGTPNNLDILGWINGHLIAVIRNPVTLEEQQEICEKEGMTQFKFELFWTPLGLTLTHPAMNGTDQKYLRTFRDYYVCRNLKKRIMPLAPFWAFENDTDNPGLIIHQSISLSDYNPDETFRVKFPFWVNFQFRDRLTLMGFHSFCHCAESDCTIKYPKDKNACSS